MTTFSSSSMCFVILFTSFRLSPFTEDLSDWLRSICGLFCRLGSWRYEDAFDRAVILMLVLPWLPPPTRAFLFCPFETQYACIRRTKSRWMQDAYVLHEKHWDHLPYNDIRTKQSIVIIYDMLRYRIDFQSPHGSTNNMARMVCDRSKLHPHLVWLLFFFSALTFWWLSLRLLLLLLLLLPLSSSALLLRRIEFRLGLAWA